MTDVTAEEFERFVSNVLAKTAAIAKRYFKEGQAIDHEIKADDSPVTQADKEIEASIREAISAEFPTHNILGEEQGRTDNHSEYTWVIDPIDGTKAFIAGKTTFTTLIGLMKNDVPIYGVVDQPITQERWISIQNRPSLAGEQASASPKDEGRAVGGKFAYHTPHASSSTSNEACSQQLPRKGGARLSVATTSIDYMSEAQKECMDAWVQKNNVDMHYGGDAYPYMKLIEGQFDAVFDVGFQPYDIIPLLPILQEAGVWVGFFEDCKPADKITNNVVVAKEAALGQSLLSCLLAGDDSN